MSVFLFFSSPCCNRVHWPTEGSYLPVSLCIRICSIDFGKRVKKESLRYSFKQFKAEVQLQFSYRLHCVSVELSDSWSSAWASWFNIKAQEWKGVSDQHLSGTTTLGGDVFPCSLLVFGLLRHRPEKRTHLVGGNCYCVTMWAGQLLIFAFREFCTLYCFYGKIPFIF